MLEWLEHLFSILYTYSHKVQVKLHLYLLTRCLHWLIGMRIIQKESTLVKILFTISHKLTAASFIPVSHIIARGTFLETTYSFHYGEDRIMITVPLSKCF